MINLHVGWPPCSGAPSMTNVVFSCSAYVGLPEDHDGGVVVVAVVM